MSESPANFSIEIEVDEKNKVVNILIPWEKVPDRGTDEFRQWVDKLAEIRAEWRDKGYQCK